jgi:hypothetical protein
MKVRKIWYVFNDKRKYLLIRNPITNKNIYLEGRKNKIFSDEGKQRETFTSTHL